MEQQIKLAAKIYKMRDTVKSLHRDGYAEHIKEYIDLINACMKKHNIKNAIEAAIHLGDQVKDMPNAGSFVLNIMAAAAEILEPSEKPVKS